MEVIIKKKHFNGSYHSDKNCPLALALQSQLNNLDIRAGVHYIFREQGGHNISLGSIFPGYTKSNYDEDLTHLSKFSDPEAVIRKLTYTPLNEEVIIS